jgi:hypothetical protein
MGDHLRKRIRAAIAEQLIGLPSIGDRVFRTRRYALSADNDLPAICIYTLTETVKTRTLAPPRLQDRILSVAVEVVSAATDDLDDQLDQICKDVEARMALDPELGGLSKDLWFESTEIKLTAAEGNQPTGSAVMKYSALYITREGAPDVSA